MKDQALQKLLNPETVAVFGGASAATVIEQCRGAGFAGEIWAVNPKREEIGGQRCYASAAELPSVPDASFVATRPDLSVDIVRELAELGAPGVVCYASGFAESGEKGKKLQDALVEAAGDMPVIGPNCHGFINYFDGVALWPDEHGGKKTDRGPAVILQSGNIGISLSFHDRSFDPGYVITFGNKCNRDFHHFIDVLIEDPRVTAIGLHIESITDVAAFSEAAIRALKNRVPIVALKAGRSEKSAAAMKSHTAAMTGSDELYDALFRKFGITRCDSIESFAETLKFLSIVGPLKSKTLASMSCSGGEAALVADYAAEFGLSMPELSAPSVDSLQTVLGPIVHIANPLDYHTYIWGNEDSLRQCYTEVLGNGNGCSILVLDYPSTGESRMSAWKIAENALIAASHATGQTAAVVATLPESIPLKSRQRLKEAGIAPMQGLRDCIFAIAAAADSQIAMDAVEMLAPVDLDTAVTNEIVALDEFASKQCLTAHGVNVPDGALCTAVDASTAAEAIGFPVVAKGVSSDVLHKTEVGGVTLNLDSKKAVDNAIHAMSKTFSRFLIEKQETGIVAELIIGAMRDEHFGVSLLIGSGGTLAELINDARVLLLPATRQDIESAVGQLGVSALLAGYRRDEKANVDALVDAVEKIAAFAFQFRSQLVELDVNPLAVTATRAVALDGVIRCRGKLPA